MDKNNRIAVIGANGVFPMAGSFDELDRIYSEKIDCIRDITPERIKLTIISRQAGQTFAGGGKVLFQNGKERIFTAKKNRRKRLCFTYGYSEGADPLGA